MAVTLADVAHRAGVSVATASRALSRSRPVGEAVAERVSAAARELGYAGNGIARALRTRRTDTIGMVVPSILNPFFTTLVDSMESALQESGKQLLLCDSRHDPAVEARHLRSLVERHVDGLVVSPTHQHASVAAVALAASSTPLVQLDRRVDVPGTDWVGLDDAAALALVMERLHRTGVRTAAFATSAMDSSSTRDRLAGFTAGAARHGIEVDPGWIVTGDYSVASGESAASRLLTGERRPAAIVCADDLIAIGVIRRAQVMGVSIPGQLQVTGIDDIEFGRYVEPELTTLHQPTGRMAQEAVRLLGLRQSDPQASPSAVRIQPRLVERGSTLAL